ncbi:MAG: hypothetical protein C0483_23035 [Pirellula sp.]|nr:hypothetical protein [Pirellula sp.]
MLKLRALCSFQRSIPHTCAGVLAYCVIGLCVSPSYATSPAADAKSDAHGIEFFEAKIRPVLAEKCYSCHSADAKALRGGLLLDTKQGVLIGGDSGPSIEPGKPDESLLIQALKFEGFEMPPSGKLSAQVIKDFEHWVKIGAPDPRTATTAIAKKGIDLEAGRKFWSFTPIGRPEPPKVADKRWASSDIDRFILAKLEAKKLKPVADADRSTWLRRVTFDLIGLPPSPAEIDAFLADKSPNAYAAVVDRLLASPQFGERWGRHWLDVARFAESSGGGRSMVFKEAWRYRDYVIDSFNADKPFKQLIAEQLAGDLLTHETPEVEREHLVATSYLLLGANNYEEQDKRVLEMDVADEQIDAVGKGLLGMTISCARCHDHKFDPIPTADYYALAGIFRSTHMLIHENVSKWTERPLPMSPETEAAVAKHEAAVAELQGKLTAAKKLAKKLTPAGILKSGPIAASELPGIVIDDTQAKRVGDWSTSRHVKQYVGEGYLTDDDLGKGEKTLTFQPEFKKAGLYDVRLSYVSLGNRAESVPVSLLTADGEIDVKVNMREEPPIDGRFLSLGKYRFDPSNQWFVMISNEGTAGFVTVDCVQFVPVDEVAAPVKTDVADADAPKAGQAVDNTVSDEAAKAAAAVVKLEREMKSLTATAPDVPKTMAVDDAETIEDCKICIRGNVHNRGAAVPRGVLQVATVGKAPQMPPDGSGRRELASWIADAENPLTSRVYVNRVWYYLFGAGLVRTVDNFGTTGESPSHPELLDYLARQFTDNGWSTKKLIRQIVLSRTYRLSTADNKQAAATDPENRLLWRMNRRRLDAEALRDAMLAVSGKLDLRAGGPGVNDPSVLKGVGTVTPTEYTYEFLDTRRSVYTPAFRNRTLELFEAFDFADPNTVAGKRNVSTVAPQALYLLNSPFVMDQAAAAGARLLAEEPAASDEARVERAFREALGRKPTDGEKSAVLAALARDSKSIDQNSEASSSDGRQVAWERVFQALFGCLDFRYLE